LWRRLLAFRPQGEPAWPFTVVWVGWRVGVEVGVCVRRDWKGMCVRVRVVVVVEVRATGVAGETRGGGGAAVLPLPVPRRGGQIVIVVTPHTSSSPP
jgi:hypothetical protein